MGEVLAFQRSAQSKKTDVPIVFATLRIQKSQCRPNSQYLEVEIPFRDVMARDINQWAEYFENKLNGVFSPFEESSVTLRIDHTRETIRICVFMIDVLTHEDILENAFYFERMLRDDELIPVVREFEF